MHFLAKLIPPRQTFMTDITDDERRQMQAHVSYTQEHFKAGKLLAYGPVMPPLGSFGVAIFEVADEAEVRRILDADPTVRSGLNRYELAPMRVAAGRAPTPG